LVQPRAILCLGDESIKAILGKSANFKESGNAVYKKRFDVRTSFEDPEAFLDIDVVACYHPSYISHSPEALPTFETSIRLFLQNLGLIEVKEKTYTTEVVTESRRLDYIVEQELSDPDRNIVAFDAEWNNDPFYLRTVQWSSKDDEAVLVAIAGPGNVKMFDEEEAAKASLKCLLSRPDIQLVGHNIRSDLEKLKLWGVDLYAVAQPPNHVDELGVKGWTLLKNGVGAFDTMFAAYAICETDRYGLDVIAAKYLNEPRWDLALEEEKTDDVDGFGNISCEVLHPYALKDAIFTRKLYTVLFDKLCCDDYGNDCWEAFWRTSWLFWTLNEAEQTGLYIDVPRLQQLRVDYRQRYTELLTELRNDIGWPDFNPNSSFQRAELVFGEYLNGKKDEEGNPIKLRPDGAISWMLQPLVTTGSNIPWNVVVEKQEQHLFNPSTDKTTLGALSIDHKEVVALQQVRFLGHALTNTLRDGEENEEGEIEYEKGLLAHLGADSRVRTHYFMAETGRITSSRPNLNNFSGSRDAQVAATLGHLYTHPLRSVVQATPGYLLVEADVSAAEVAIAAWQSQDPVLMDDVRRSLLPEDHPDKLDIHANNAVMTFKLTCKPTKKGLGQYVYLRTGAKRTLFGWFYRQGVQSARLKILEEGVKISLKEVESLQRYFRERYSVLNSFFSFCGERAGYPRWLATPAHRYRRFPKFSNSKDLESAKREACNMDIQSPVADYAADCLRDLYVYRQQDPSVSYTIVGQIYDSIILEVPYASVEKVYNEVFPECMIRRRPYYPADLDGKPLGVGPYRFDIEKKIYEHWGEPITPERLEELGLPKTLVGSAD
jgi:DNA polymerase I-like protein with 3'-5' exonuclease and polymerase domains